MLNKLIKIYLITNKYNAYHPQMNKKTIKNEEGKQIIKYNFYLSCMKMIEQFGRKIKSHMLLK